MNELDLFAAAIAIADRSERALLLERECAGRPELRLRLDQLLDAHFHPSPLLDQPDVEETQGRDQTQDNFAPVITIPGNPGNPGQDEQAGVVIAGKYTLVEGIGKGGMGSVWRARQTAPVKRFVAVKLIKAGMDSKQVLARFDAERQALALMDHPNIASAAPVGASNWNRTTSPSTRRMTLRRSMEPSPSWRSNNRGSPNSSKSGISAG